MGKEKGKKKHDTASSHLSPTGLPSVRQVEKELTATDLAGIDTVIEKVCVGYMILTWQLITKGV